MHLRWIAIFSLTLLIVVTGCSSPRPGNLNKVQPLSDRPRAGNVYLLRGFIGVFSTGIDSLTRQINEAGIRANVYQDDQWLALARRIRQQYANASDPEPLVLVGHSYGADDVIRIARELSKSNIKVDLLVTLDPVTPPPVPSNVRHCINLYQSQGAWDRLPFLRGVAVQQAVPGAGKLENFDLRSDRLDLLEANTNHFNIEKKQRVHEEVVGHVLSVCVPRRTWLASRDRGLPSQAEARLAGSQSQTAESPSDPPAAAVSTALDEPRRAGHQMGN